MKTPRMLDATLGLANRYPFTDALEVFQGNTPTGVFGLRNQQFGDDVVHVIGEPGFFTPSLLKEPLCRLGTLRLESGPQSGMTGTQTIDRATRVGFAIRVSRDIDDTEVHAQPVFRFIGRRLGHIHDHGEVELAVTVDEVNLPANVLQPGSLIAAEDDGNELPPLERQDGYAVKAFPGQHPLVIDDTTVRLEDRFLGLIPLIGFAGLGDGTDRKLRGESEGFSNIAVDEALEPNLVGRSLLEGNFGDDVAGGVKPLHRLDERNGLFGRRLEFDQQRQVHDSSIAQYRQYINQREGTAIPPRIKTLGFLAGNI